MTYGTSHLLIGGGKEGYFGGGGQEKILLFFLRGMGHYSFRSLGILQNSYF